MIVVKDICEIQEKEFAATIGFFDGVHLGHRFLINELKQVAALRNLPTAVITFPIHPRKVLQADYQPKLLNSFDEKLEHLAETGIDYCIVLDFTTELSKLTANQFITSILKDQLHVRTLLIGYDHRFGRDRTDSFVQYVQYGKDCGIEVMEARCFTENQIAVSSSEIRKLLINCQIEEAAKLLTYPYILKGNIVSGYKVGRTLGFPTANIQVDEPFKVYPGIGVYAVWVDLQEKRYKGMLYIGSRPTVNNGDNMTLEVNILDFSGDIYNNEITVSFIYYIRGDIKFNSLDELKAQLEEDREEVNKRLVIND